MSWGAKVWATASAKVLGTCSLFTTTKLFINSFGWQKSTNEGSQTHMLISIYVLSSIAKKNGGMSP